MARVLGNLPQPALLVSFGRIRRHNARYDTYYVDDIDTTAQCNSLKYGFVLADIKAVILGEAHPSLKIRSLLVSSFSKITRMPACHGC